MRDYWISDSSIVIGSSETADIRDTDRSVQPRHARLSHEPQDGLVHELDRLRARIEVLDEERRARDTRIGELRAENGALRATLDSIRKDLAESRERQEAAVAELRHRLDREHRELAALSRLYDQGVRDLSEAQTFLAELRQIVDAQQAEDGHE